MLEEPLFITTKPLPEREGEVFKYIFFSQALG